MGLIQTQVDLGPDPSGWPKEHRSIDSSASEAARKLVRTVVGARGISVRPSYCVQTLYWVSEGASVWAGVPCHLRASAHTMPGRPCCEHHPDLTDEESAAQRGHVTCLGDTVHNWGHGSWDSDSLGPGWVPDHAQPCFFLGLALLYDDLVGPQLILLPCEPCFQT